MSWRESGTVRHLESLGRDFGSLFLPAITQILVLGPTFNIHTFAFSYFKIITDLDPRKRDYNSEEWDGFPPPPPKKRVITTRISINQ